MYKKFVSVVKPLLKSLFLIALVAVLALGHPSDALAARTGGRIGGGSFRAPSSRTYSPPGGGYSRPGGGYYPGGGGYYPGGGFGFPFVFPLFGFGGGFGGLFTILIFLAIANFLVQSFRRIGSDDSLDGGSPKVSVARLQVGLLADARELQSDLNRIAETADTGTSAGLSRVLQETNLALLRHPEYWVYAGAESKQARLEAAEVEFNRMVLAERSKLAKETLTNVNGQSLKAGDTAVANLSASGAPLATSQKASDGPGEYIVATLLVAAQGNLSLPAINSSDDLRRALEQLGGFSGDRLMALEVLWEPQEPGDTLTAEELISEYPTLKLV